MDHRGSEWQLVFFTILTQMGVGTFTFWGIAAVALPAPNPLLNGIYPSALLIVVLASLVMGTLSAGLHLGSPSHAVFSISNLRSSWLSREALLGGSFGLVSMILLIRRWLGLRLSILDGIFILAGGLCGLTLVYGISRLYMLRTVPAWNNLGTPAAFFTTSFQLGIVTVAAVSMGLAVSNYADVSSEFLSRLLTWSTLMILTFSVVQLGISIFVALYLNNRGGAAAESVHLLWTKLRTLLICRCGTLFLGVGILALSLVVLLTPISLFLTFGLIFVSEILGLFLFYGYYHREGF